MKTLKKAWNLFAEFNPMTFLFGLDVIVALFVLAAIAGIALQWAISLIPK